jgi:hypothetical protein
MRRLFAIWSAVGLLCGALGCHSSPDNHGKMHGRCDCDDGWGCHPEMYYQGAGHAAMAAPAALPAEQLKALPKEEAK